MALTVTTCCSISLRTRWPRRRRREADFFAERPVRSPRLGQQQRDQPAVEFVHLDVPGPPHGEPSFEDLGVDQGVDRVHPGVVAQLSQQFVQFAGRADPDLRDQCVGPADRRHEHRLAPGRQPGDHALYRAGHRDRDVRDDVLAEQGRIRRGHHAQASAVEEFLQPGGDRAALASRRVGEFLNRGPAISLQRFDQCRVQVRTTRTGYRIR
ncbi:hypothetical protein [Amycolatopsis sp. La24]|uniref:hypothetical protein n=1 Tax=Amycolatopsis sp. La24 TaxID=3028304 RepID=UPI0023B20464|nr:hypothetical protein [Amycolatopsis sp. La24]